MEQDAPLVKFLSFFMQFLVKILAKKVDSLELAPFLRNPGSATVSIISMKLKQLKLGKNGLISPPCNHMSQNVLSLGCD